VKQKTIIVTGGLGYIGSHTIACLADNGWRIHVIDNLSTSNLNVLSDLKILTGHDIGFDQLDVRDTDALSAAFKTIMPDAIIHFAGLKVADESLRKPLDYYSHNVAGALSVLSAMKAINCHRLVFSSSAAVYGVPEHCPISETDPFAAVTPYGQSKAIVEKILLDMANTLIDEAYWQFSILRYFNPVGAHPSGQIGENPLAGTQNLMPILSKVALGKLEKLSVFGQNFDTIDGTGVRDYIHVMDLARGHVHALNELFNHPKTNSYCQAFNLGTGRGYSVLEMTAAFDRASGRHTAIEFAPPRTGDAPMSFADVTKAKNELGWSTKHDLNDMMKSHWDYLLKVYASDFDNVDKVAGEGH